MSMQKHKEWKERKGRKERLGEAWERCRLWLEREGPESEAGIHVRMLGLDPARVRSGVLWLSGAAERCFVGEAWRDAERLESELLPLETLVTALETGDLYGLNMEYTVALESGRMEALFTVYHRRDGSFVGRGYTEPGMIVLTGGGVREKLEALLVHLLGVEERFGGEVLRLELGGPGEVVVEV